MRARNLYFCLSFALVSSTLSAHQVSAEFRCASEISYKWVKTATEPRPLHGAAAPVAVPGQTPVTTQPPPPKPTPEPTVVRLMGLERAGVDENTAKVSLQMEVDRQRIRASEACKRDHESYGTCMALKMSARSTILNSLSFNARADLEKALAEECKQQEGTCLGVDVTEPKCREIVEAKPTEPAAAAADKKADAKKKK